VPWETVDSYESKVGAFDHSISHVVITSGGPQASLAGSALSSGLNVVTTTGDPGETERLLELDAEARSRGLSVVVGAGFFAGFSGLLASLSSMAMDEVTEIHIAHAGTGGNAFSSAPPHSGRSKTQEWRDRRWVPVPSGSGRELVWFPEPIGGKDCYRVASGETKLLLAAHPSLRTVTAKAAMSGFDRVMLALPVPITAGSEDAVGAVRVEVRGFRQGGAESMVMAVLDHADLVSAALVAEVLDALGEGRAPKGANGLAAWPDAARILGNLHRKGIRAAEFTGQSD
jgi:hypothetical protein